MNYSPRKSQFQCSPAANWILSKHNIYTHRQFVTVDSCHYSLTSFVSFCFVASSPVPKLWVDVFISLRSATFFSFRFDTFFNIPQVVIQPSDVKHLAEWYWLAKYFHLLLLQIGAVRAVLFSFVIFIQSWKQCRWDLIYSNEKSFKTMAAKRKSKLVIGRMWHSDGQPAISQIFHFYHHYIGVTCVR